MLASVSLSLASHHSSFGEALRFLSHIAVDGELSMSCCSYGTGTMFVDFVPVPGVAAVWSAVQSLAFSDEGYDGDVFVGGWSVGKDNSRAAALDHLIEAVTKS
jgi:hypothetical protein